MSALNATIQSLLANAGVAALVGRRIYPITAPQGGAVPYIVVHLISERDDFVLAGHAGYPEARVSVDCRSTKSTEAQMIGEAVKAALQPLHLAPSAGVTVSFRKEGSDYSDYADESQIYRRIMDFYARWQ